MTNPHDFDELRLNCGILYCAMGAHSDKHAISFYCFFFLFFLSLFYFTHLLRLFLVVAIILIALLTFAI